MGWAALGGRARPSTSPEGTRPPANRLPANAFAGQFAPPEYFGQFGAPDGYLYPSNDSSPENVDSRRPRRHSTEISVELREAVRNQALVGKQMLMPKDMSGRPRRRRNTYEVGVVGVGGAMTRGDREYYTKLRQGLLGSGHGNPYGEYAAAPHVDSSFGSNNVTKRRTQAANFGSEPRGTVTSQHVLKGVSSTSGPAHQLYKKGDTNVTAYVGHSVWGGSREDTSVPEATAAARAARNGAPRVRPPPFKLPDDPRYRPVKAVINAKKAVSLMAKLAGVQERAGAVEGDILAEAAANAAGGNRFLAKFAAKAGGGGGAAAAPAKLFAAAAAAPQRLEALDEHVRTHMPAYPPPLGQPPFGAPPPNAPPPFVPLAAWHPPGAPLPALPPMGGMGMPPAGGHAMFPPQFPPPPGALLLPPGALAPPLPPPPPPGFARDWPLEKWQAWHAERGIVPPRGLWEYYMQSVSG